MLSKADKTHVPGPDVEDPNFDLDDKMDFAVLAGLGKQKSVGIYVKPRNECIALQQAINGIGCLRVTLSNIRIWLPKSVKQRFDSVIDIAPLKDKCSWILLSEKQDIEMTVEVERFVNRRDGMTPPRSIISAA